MLDLKSLIKPHLFWVGWYVTFHASKVLFYSTKCTIAFEPPRVVNRNKLTGLFSLFSNEPVQVDHSSDLTNSHETQFAWAARSSPFKICLHFSMRNPSSAGSEKMLQKQRFQRFGEKQEGGFRHGIKLIILSSIRW